MSERTAEKKPKPITAKGNQLSIADVDIAVQPSRPPVVQRATKITGQSEVTVEESFLSGVRERVNHKDREHALCSASGSERWLACSGSVAMCEIVGHTIDSAAAQQGTQAHELIHKRLYPVVLHWNKTGQMHPELHDAFDFVLHDSYPRDMFDYTTGYVELIVDLIKTYKPKKVFLEQKVYMDRELGLWGTSDTFFAFKHQGKKILAVYDYKHGSGKFVPAFSSQLFYYTCCIAQMLWEKSKVTFDEYWLNIYQPRLPDEETDETEEGEDRAHRMYVPSPEEVNQWDEKFRAGAEKALVQIGKPVKDLELSAGEHCYFCDAKGICPAYGKMMNDHAGLDFDELPALGAVIEEIKTEIVAGNTDIIAKEQLDHLVKIIKAKGLIKKLLSDADDIAINLFFQGFDLGDLKVVQPNGRRGWSSDTGAVAKTLQRMGIENPFSDKLRSLGSIEEELRKVKEISAVSAKQLLEPLVKKSLPRFALVSLDDPRPAASGNEQAALDFDDIEPVQ